MPEGSLGKGRVWPHSAVAVLVLSVLPAVPQVAQAQMRVRDRVLEPAGAFRWSVVQGNLRPAARAEFDVGDVDPARSLSRVTMFFSRTAQQQADLDSLLAQQQDRASVNYHRWLSPEEFAGRFGLSQGDIDKIVAWLQSQGLAIEEVSRSRTWVAFSGAARQVESALHTDLRRYRLRGESHFAASREPSVPAAFASVVLGFRGLHDFRLKPRSKKLQRRFTSEISGNHFLSPGDLATIYNLAPLYSAGINGSGQKIAIAGQSDIDVTDVQTFRALSGLPTSVPQKILVPQAVTGDSDPGMVETDIDEAYLDVEWAGAVARNALIIYVYSQHALDAFTYIIDQNLAPVLSISYGLCEGGTEGFTAGDANLLASIAQEGNAKGITIVAPSGDSGAADCDFDDTVTVAEQGLSVDLPGALPYATSVGGTQFIGDASDPPAPSGYWGPVVSNPSTALSYIPETAWNETGQTGMTGLAATGGGSSMYFAAPDWQTGTGVPNNVARSVPDISFTASANHDGYLVCSRDAQTNSPSCVNGYRKLNDDLTVFGGTSAGVPVFAGIVALLNQMTNSPQGQGNINYILYPLATSFPGAFHDITSGDNRVPCRTTPPPASPDCPIDGPNAGFLGFEAGAGYDRVTGLGSVDAHSLVTAWTSVSSTDASKGATLPDFQLALSPPKLNVTRGSSATATLILIGINGFSGAINVSCAASQPFSCSVSNQSGNSRTVTVSVASSGTSIPRSPAPPFTKLMWTAALAAAILCMMLSVRGGWLRWLPALACFCLLLACKEGGGANGNNVPAPSEGSITVQGTSGNISHTAGLSVTVN